MKETGTKIRKAPTIGHNMQAFSAADPLLRHMHANDILPEYEEIDGRSYTPSDMIIREKLYSAIEHEDINVFIQPIVTLPQRKAAFYEIFGRLRINAGEYVGADHYLKIAQEENLNERLDTLVFVECLNVFQEFYKRTRTNVQCFVNIKPSIMRNHDYMSVLLGVFKNHRDLAHNLIFEMPFRDYLTLSAPEIKVLEGLHSLGCRFSADHLTHIPTNLNMLKARHIEFIKIPASVLFEGALRDDSFIKMSKQKSLIDSFGIQIIAERVEDEQTLVNLFDFDIAYGQGFLFGRPDFKSVYSAAKV